MKIRVTFEVDDTDRVAISVYEGSGFKNATRAQMEVFIEDAVSAKLDGLRERFQLATSEIIGELQP